MREFCLITGLSCHPYPSDDAMTEEYDEGYEFVLKVKEWVRKERRKDEEEAEKKKKGKKEA